MTQSVCGARMEDQLTLEEILREGMIGNPRELHSDELQRAAELGDTEGGISANAVSNSK